MALIQCPECGKEISNKAKSCIHCGYPLDLIVSEEVIPENNDTVVDNEIGEINSVVCADTVVLEAIKQEDITEEKQNAESKQKKTIIINGGKYELWKVILAGVVAFSLIVVLLAYKPVMYANAMNKFESGEYERAKKIFEMLAQSAQLFMSIKVQCMMQ